MISEFRWVRIKRKSGSILLDNQHEKNKEVYELLKPLQESAIERAKKRNIINLRLDITHLYYPAKNSFQKGRLKRREIFTELLLYTLTT